MTGTILTVPGAGGDGLGFNSGNDGTLTIAVGPTGAKVNALTISAAGVPTFNQLAQSLTSNGYKKLDGGLIVQWGTTSAITSGSFVSVTFPIAFPTAALSVATTLSSGVIAANYTAGVSSLTTTGMNVSHFSSGGSAGYFWIALGY